MAINKNLVFEHRQKLFHAQSLKTNNSYVDGDPTV